MWSPERQGQDEGERAINPAEGWDVAWTRQNEQIESAKARESQDPKGRKQATRECASLCSYRRD